MDCSEQFRHECEIRYWLADTGGAPARVADVIERIRKRRGQAAADRVLKDMRATWAKQRGKRS